ncbi:hypothetical protein [uncultured Kocuria sp.]|uniref:hypothetical protein n=1 Tax=uncultured Kocuria sp. TaxID=259305 RepID=UPI00262C40B5|nr:hypothetical protein [uncultured Kocuria sp.]
MAVVSIEVRGGTELAQKLRKFGVALLDLSQGMEEAGDYLTDFFSGEVFASRGQVFGEPWAPLSSSYAAYKARRWPGRPPLVKSGELMGSFKSTNTRLTARVNNTAPHFPWIQEGTSRMPARVVMKVDDTRERQVVELIRSDISRHMEVSGV